MKTYLITGGAGYLGRNIIKVLCENNVDEVGKIIIFDLNVPANTMKKLTAICNKANIEILYELGSIIKMGELNKCFDKYQGQIDVVLHCAAMIDYRGLVDEQLLRNINVNGTRYVMDACLRHNVHNFVYTSSIEAICPNLSRDDFVDGDESTVYGGPAYSTYGRSKFDAENLVLGCHGYKTANQEKFRTVALRMSGCYGPKDPFIDPFIEKSLKRNEAVAIKTRKTTRMFVKNAAWCHLLAAKKLQTDPDKVGGRAYFIRDDSPDLPYLLQTLHFLSHRGIPHKYAPIPFWLLLAIVWLVTAACKFVRLFGLDVQPRLTHKTLLLLQTEFTVNDAKFRRDFDYKPLYDWKTSRNIMRAYVDKYARKLNL